MTAHTRRVAGFTAVSATLTSAVACGLDAPGSGGVTPLGVGVAIAAAGLPWLFYAALRRPIERSEATVRRQVQAEPQPRQDVSR